MDTLTLYGELFIPTSLLYRLGSPGAVETCLHGVGILPTGARVARWRQEPMRAAYVLEYVYELALVAPEEARDAGP